MLFNDGRPMVGVTNFYTFTGITPRTVHVQGLYTETEYEADTKGRIEFLVTVGGGSQQLRIVGVYYKDVWYFAPTLADKGSALPAWNIQSLNSTSNPSGSTLLRIDVPSGTMVIRTHPKDKAEKGKA